jgi:hypothetical protein
MVADYYKRGTAAEPIPAEWKSLLLSAPSLAASSLTAGQPVLIDTNLEDDETFTYAALVA